MSYHRDHFEAGPGNGGGIPGQVGWAQEPPGDSLAGAGREREANDHGEKLVLQRHASRRSAIGLVNLAQSANANFWSVCVPGGTWPRLAAKVHVTSLTYTSPRESTAMPCGAAKLPAAVGS